MRWDVPACAEQTARVELDGQTGRVELDEQTARVELDGQTGRVGLGWGSERWGIGLKIVIPIHLRLITAVPRVVGTGAFGLRRVLVSCGGIGRGLSVGGAVGIEVDVFDVESPKTAPLHGFGILAVPRQLLCR